MKIRMFWVKLAGVLFIALVLAVYQVNALSMQAVREVMETVTSVQGEQGYMSGQPSGPGAVTPGAFSDGIYSGTGYGYRGELSVRVTISGGRIETIEITECSDDKAYLAMAEPVIDEIISRQTVEGVDTVSGATLSSGGILEAVENALNEGSY